MTVKQDWRWTVNALTLLVALPTVGCGYAVTGLPATRTTSSSLSYDGGDLAPYDTKVRMARTLDLCEGTQNQIRLVDQARTRSKDRVALASVVVTGLGGLTAGGAQIFSDDLGKTPTNITTGAGLIATGVGLIGGFYLAFKGSDSELDSLRATVSTIDAERAAYDDAVKEKNLDKMEQSLSVLHRSCTRAADGLASYNGDPALATSFGAVSRNNLDASIRKALDRQTNSLDESRAIAQLKSLAIGLGYQDATALVSWRVGDGGIQTKDISMVEVAKLLETRAAKRDSGTVLLGLWSPPGDAAPAYRLSAIVKNGYGPQALSVMGVPLVAPGLELLDRRVPGSPHPSVAQLIGMAPYAKNLPPTLNEWVCSTFPIHDVFAPPPPGVQPVATPPVPPNVEVRPEKCPAIHVPIIPSTPTNLPGYNQLRRGALLPDAPTTDWAKDDILSIVAEPVSTGRTPGPALAVLVWVSGRP